MTMTKVCDLATETLTVNVPMAGGVILGGAVRRPWLATDLGEALSIADMPWPGQPVFRDEVTARAWIAEVEAVNPQLGPWTVAERTARLQPMTDGGTRLHLQ